MMTVSFAGGLKKLFTGMSQLQSVCDYFTAKEVEEFKKLHDLRGLSDPQIALLLYLDENNACIRETDDFRYIDIYGKQLKIRNETITKLIAQDFLLYDGDRIVCLL